MKPSEYQELAQVTEHDEAGYEQVAQRVLATDVGDAIIESLEKIEAECEKLDLLKKIAMYGKNGGRIEGLVVPAKLQKATFTPGQAETADLRVFHGLLGLITEAGELATPLKNLLINGDYDKVNVAEELGDMSWYKAITLSALKKRFGDIWTTNIAKLKARFGDKFNEHRALNRDLDAEREILEEG